jgi:hypothetical protein
MPAPRSPVLTYTTTETVEDVMTHFTDGNDPRVMAGRARMRAIAVENAAEIEKVIAHLIQGLKRPPTPGEELEAELVAVAFVKARRLRERCRDDSKERRLLGQMMKQSIFGSAPAPSPREIQQGSAVTDVVGPKEPGRAYFVAEKGDDPAPDGATVPDEVSHVG